ncbi:IncF plasmid conjugative transfer pilus assembly protein TraH [uncultured Candidatus Thioglobus sp.]|nr:IncF plasmid conjugative transfer pilus assembly protein TraH [uncultured Candidatus Thioglobus sp.]
MNNKYYINISIIILSLSINVNAGWMDDWVDQSTSSGPSYFEGQKRGYFNGGSYSARYRQSNEYLFSVSKPRLKSGCGGIDLFLGGVSFMDPEYLMQKLQRAIQMAPAVAFDLALKSMAPEISSTVKEFEALINDLNDMQISECAIAKEAVSAARGKFEGESGGLSEIYSLLDSRLSADNSGAKNFTNSKEQQRANDGKTINEQKDSVKGCSPKFKSIFTTNGSVLKHIADSKGLGQYADYMRAYLGDVIIGYSDKQFTSRMIGACENQDVTKIDDIILGKGKIKPVSGSCTEGGDRALLTTVETHLTSIAQKMKTKSSPSANELKFLNALPFNIFNALRYAIDEGIQDSFIATYKDVIARMMAYAMVEDLISSIYELTRVASAQASQGNNGASTSSCEVVVVTPVLLKVEKLKQNALLLQGAIRKSRSELTKEVNNTIQFNKHFTTSK